MDAGDMLWTGASVPPREAPQRRLKAELLLEASAALGVDALGVGDGDLAFGLDFLVEGAKKHRLPYVGANLGDLHGKPVFAPWLVVEKGGRRIGITSVLSERHSLQGVTIDPPRPALERAVRELREQGKAELVVVLSHLGSSEDRTLTATVEGVDLVFAAHDRKHLEEPMVVGDAAIMEAGSRGKTLGQVDILFRDGAGWTDPGAAERIGRQRALYEQQVARYEEQLASAGDPSTKARLERVLGFSKQRMEDLVVPPADDGKRSVLRSRKVDMSRLIDDQPAMKKLVDATLDQLGDEPGARDDHAGHDHAGHDHAGHDHAEHEPAGPPQASMGDWVGANACRGCHLEQWQDWRETGHATAYVTLIREKRHLDHDCWSCHVTGAMQEGGPQGPKEVGILRGVQCEACHGPGRKHLADPQVDMVRDPGQARCESCHTEEQTEGRFVFGDYLPKIDHK